MLDPNTGLIRNSGIPAEDIFTKNLSALSEKGKAVTAAIRHCALPEASPEAIKNAIDSIRGEINPDYQSEQSARQPDTAPLSPTDTLTSQRKASWTAPRARVMSEVVTKTNQFLANTRPTKPLSYKETNEAVCKAAQEAKLQHIEAKGGHGGFYKATVTVNDEEKNLFLKPFDPAESANYAFVQKQSAGNEDKSILKFMPRVYGEVEIGGKKYMIMENLFNTGGKKWSQISDLKMTRGGQFDPAELKATGRKQKTGLTSLVMSGQATFAGDYLTMTKSKFGRSVNALRSDTAFTGNIQKSLANLEEKKRPEALRNLESQLKELADLMKSSPMGFIGASIFIFTDNEGQFKIYLADPAHAQADPMKHSREAGKMYYGSQDSLEGNIQQFEQRRSDNIRSIEAMANTVNSMQTEGAVRKSSLFKRVKASNPARSAAISAPTPLKGQKAEKTGNDLIVDSVAARRWTLAVPTRSGREEA